MDIPTQFTNLRREVGIVTGSPYLDAVRIETLLQIQEGATSESYLRAIATQLLFRIGQASIDSYDSHREIYQLTSEAKFYMYLKRSGLEVQHVPKGATMTPDFKVSHAGQEFLVEVKAPINKRGQLGFERYQYDRLASKTQAEVEASDKGVGVGCAAYQPYNDDSSNYDAYSPCIVINALHDKISQNCKAGQLGPGPSLLAVDISALAIIGDIAENSVPLFTSRTSYTSGQLWHVAFGRPGMVVFREPEFEGKSNIDCSIEFEGILVEGEVGGLIFFRGDLSSHEAEIVAFCRSGDDDIRTVLAEITDLTNDELNESSYSFRFAGDRGVGA